VVEARILQLKVEGMLPVDPGANRVRSRPVGADTSASCPGDSPGLPPEGYGPTNSSSPNRTSGRSRIFIAGVLSGHAARAVRTVLTGIRWKLLGRNDTAPTLQDPRPPRTP
jgi:hypothetical protein